MAKFIARLELCRESLKRIIHTLIKNGSHKNGKCLYCGEKDHTDNCIFETAEKVTGKVRSNKKKPKKDKNAK